MTTTSATIEQLISGCENCNAEASDACLALAAMGEQKQDAGAPRIVDSKEAIAKWLMKPRGGDAGSLRNVMAGRKVFVRAAATGLRTADFGQPGIVADIRFFSPDGKVMFKGRNGCGVNRGDASTPGLVVLKPVLDLTSQKRTSGCS